MSLDPAIFRALVANGATSEQLLAVVEAAAAVEEEKRARQIPWPRLRLLAFDRDGERCQYCASTDGPFEVDHIVPRVEGGESTLENVCVSCRTCNRSKKDSPAEVFAARRREKDRERKARKRAEVRGHPEDTAELSALPPSLDKETSPRPPKEINPTPGEHTHTGARGWKLPAGVDADHWRDFLANRQRKRLASTPTAYRAQLKALTELADDEWPPGRIVQFAAERGWGAIFDPRGREDGRRNGTDRLAGNHRQGSGFGVTIDAANDFIADQRRQAH